MSNLQLIINSQQERRVYIGRKFNENAPNLELQQSVTKKIYQRLQQKIQQKNIEYLSNYTNVESMSQRSSISVQSSPQRKETNASTQFQADSQRKSQFLQQAEGFQGQFQQHQNKNSSEFSKFEKQNNQQIKSQLEQQNVQSNAQLNKYDHIQSQKFEEYVQNERKNDNIHQEKTRQQSADHNQQTQISFYSTKPNTARTTNNQSRVNYKGASHNIIYPSTHSKTSKCNSPQKNLNKHHNSILTSAGSKNNQQDCNTPSPHMYSRQTQKNLNTRQQTQESNQYKEDNQVQIKPFDEQNSHDEHQKQILSKMSSPLQLKVILKNKQDQKQALEQNSSVQKQRRPQTAFSKDTMNQKVDNKMNNSNLMAGNFSRPLSRHGSQSNLLNNAHFDTQNQNNIKQQSQKNIQSQSNFKIENQSKLRMQTLNNMQTYNHINSQNNLSTQILEDENTYRQVSRTNLKSALPGQRGQLTSSNLNNNTQNIMSQSVISNEEIQKQEKLRRRQDMTQQLSSQPRLVSLNSKLSVDEKQERYRTQRKKQSDILPFFDYKGEEYIRYLHLFLYLKKADILQMIYNFAESTEQLEETIWEIVQKAVETRQLKILAKILIFVGQIQIAVGSLDKSSFFLNQARICCDMLRDTDKLKSQLYSLLGDICIYTTRYEDSICLYKKSLQYAWYCNSKDEEIDVYDKLGIAYYYIQDLKKSSFYHMRSMECDYETDSSHLKKISNEVTHEIRKSQKEDQAIINYMVYAHLSLPLNFAEMDLYNNSLNNTIINVNQNNNETFNSRRGSKLLFTALNRQPILSTTEGTEETFTSQPLKGIVNNDATQIVNTSMNMESSNQKHRHHLISRPSTSMNPSKIIQPFTQVSQSRSRKRSSEDDFFKINSAKQEQEEEERKQHESTARMKKQLYLKTNLDNIVDNVLKEDDFIFQMSTPKHSVSTENPEQIEKTKFQIQREKFENSNLRRVSYDVSSFGVVSQSQSQRKFDDLTLYKFPIEKQIEVLKNDKFKLSDIWYRVNKTLASLQHYNQRKNDRIRVNQNTPNRCAQNYKNFPKITSNKIRNIYEKLLKEFEIRNDNKNQ